MHASTQFRRILARRFPFAIPAGIAVMLFTLVSVIPSATATAKERLDVTVSYVLAPTQKLPENIRAVAVIDSGVDSDEERKDIRKKKWSNIAADLIEAMLQSAANDRPDALKIVQRRATKQILAEQDLQLVGIVEGDALERAGRILAVDGLIMSRINLSIDYQRSRRSQIDWVGLLGGGPGAPPPSGDPRFRRGPGGAPPNPYRAQGRPAGPALPFNLPQRDIEEISRHLTVQCTFSLVDAVTGRAIVQHASPVVQKSDRKRPDFFFGTCIDEADLDPVDYFIGELVERAAQEFVSRIAPVRVAYTYEVIGKSEGEDGIRALRADDYATAFEIFRAAHARKPKRQENVFALGIVSELMGDYRQALLYYRQACSMKVDDEELAVYMSAKDRLTAHIDRIVQPPDGERPTRAERPADADSRRPPRSDDDEDEDDD